MMRKSFLLALCGFCLGCLSANAQYDFFWSDRPLNSGAVNGDLSLDAFDEQGSIYLYYSTDGPADSNSIVGALLNVTASKPGVIKFTQAETMDFDILVADIVIGTRWQAHGNIGSVQDDQICRWGAVTSIVGNGINGANTGPVFFDSGYDPVADAFLFGRIDFDVIACGRDSVDIIISIDEGQLAFEFDCDVQPAPSIGSATITNPSLLVLGDVNLDGELNLLDVQPFANLVTEQIFAAEADINKDQAVNLLDVAPFVDLLTGVTPPVKDECEDNSSGEPNEKCLVGDSNQDGAIDILDDAALVQNVVQGNYLCESDINEDGVVNVMDIACWIDMIFDL